MKLKRNIKFRTSVFLVLLVSSMLLCGCFSYSSASSGALLESLGGQKTQNQYNNPNNSK